MSLGLTPLFDRKKDFFSVYEMKKRPLLRAAHEKNKKCDSKNRISVPNYLWTKMEMDSYNSKTRKGKIESRELKKTKSVEKS